MSNVSAKRLTTEQQLIQQGIQRGERGVLLLLLRKRFGALVNIDTEHRIAVASSEQIALWAERVLLVATLAEVLAD